MLLLLLLQCASICMLLPQGSWQHGVVLPGLHTRQGPCTSSSSSTQPRQRAPQHIEVAASSSRSSGLTLVTAAALNVAHMLLWLWLLLTSACCLLMGGR
jgi:hypothetical protein